MLDCKRFVVSVVMVGLSLFAGLASAATQEQAYAAILAASDQNGECQNARDAASQGVADVQYLRGVLIDEIAPQINNTTARKGYIDAINAAVDGGLAQYYSTTSGFNVWVDVQADGIALLATAESWASVEDYDQAVTVAGQSSFLTGSAEPHFASMASEAEETLAALQAILGQMLTTIALQGM